MNFGNFKAVGKVNTAKPVEEIIQEDKKSKTKSISPIRTKSEIEEIALLPKVFQYCSSCKKETNQYIRNNKVTCMTCDDWYSL